MAVDKSLRRIRRAARRLRGFTLIEMLIVVAIIAILAAIAVPIYSENVRKSRRGQAKALVVELAQRFERFHTVNNTYVGAFAAVVPAVDRQSPNIAGATSAYAITNPVVTANTFTLTATPVGQQLEDLRCLAIGLNQAGVKTEGGSGSLSDCW